MSRLGAPLREVCTRGHDMDANRKRHPNGDTYCYACKMIRYTAHRKAHPAIHRTYRKNSRRRTWYGLEPAEYQELLTQQDGKCAVCKKDDWGIRGPHVDHNHEDESVRGLLCHRCNTALGLFKDNSETLSNALAYLAKTGKSNKDKKRG